MSFRFIYPLLFCTLAACSVYKNSGRNQFEDRAPNSINSVSASSSGQSSYDTDVEDEQTCWSQPATDPLWDLDIKTGFGEKFENELTVKRISNSEIQVCTRPLE